MYLPSLFSYTKDNYGSGYLLQLNLAQDNEETINSLLEFVQKNIHEEAKIVTKQAKTIHINLPRDVNIQKIFTTLYSDSAAEGKNSCLYILTCNTSISYSNTTLICFIFSNDQSVSRITKLPRGCVLSFGRVNSNSDGSLGRASK